MQKFKLILLLLSILQVSHAQEETTFNRFVIGGAASFSTRSYESPISNFISEQNSFSVSITPYFAKEISKHLLIGIQPIYRRYIINTEYSPQYENVSFSNAKFASNLFEFGVFTRYVMNVERRFNFFLQPFIGYLHTKENLYEDKELSLEGVGNSLKFVIDLGVLYHLNDKFRLTLRNGGLYYQSGKSESKPIGNSSYNRTESKISSFQGFFSLSRIFFGVEVRL